MPKIETRNDYLLAVQGDGIRFLRATPRGVISKANALRMAAWIVALADDDNEFLTILEAVQNT